MATHDGIVYFPQELMPKDLIPDVNSNTIVGGNRVSGLNGIVPPFILKTKKLNLKLKFKK